MLPRYTREAMGTIWSALRKFQNFVRVEFGALVPLKGDVLVALTVFWLTGPLSQFKNHLIAYGKHIDEYLPQELRNQPDLHRRGLVVHKHVMLLLECIARGYLTGSGWGSYQREGHVCGIALPSGLHDGSKLEEAIFTPTTKAEVGHDEHVNTADAIARHGSWPRVLTLSLYNSAADYALQRGIIIADTKFEFGVDHTLADEVLTPDSSRFWDVEDYAAAQLKKKSPSGYDKEPVRQAGKVAIIEGHLVDISKLSPENPDHVVLVSGWEMPPEVVSQTTERYLTIVERLTGMTLNHFQVEVMGV